MKRERTKFKPYVSPFSRCGSKRRMRHFIKQNIPTHITYVEPFCGGATIFFDNPPASQSVLNDMDEELMYAFQLLKDGLSNTKFRDIYSAELMYGCRSTDKELQSLFKKQLRDIYTDLCVHGTTNEEKYQCYIIKTSGTYGYIPFEKVSCIQRVPSKKKIQPTQKALNHYKNVLSNTELLCTNGVEVMKQYDSPDTFMFVDPPYENSDRLYTHSDHTVVNDILDFMVDCESKVLLTFNDSPSVIDYASNNGLHTFEFLLPNMSPACDLGKERTDIVVTNYKIKTS